MLSPTDFWNWITECFGAQSLNTWGMIEKSTLIARKPISFGFMRYLSCRPVFLSALLIVSLFSYALAEVRNIISFYNPETDISSFTSLKVSYDNYLSKRTVYRLQPFKDRATFENINEGKLSPVMLISSWHYHLLDAKLKQRIRPALIATQNGISTARKILTTKKSISSLDDLRGAVIASAADSEYTRELMFDLFHDFPDDLVQSIEVLSVPKEIDALMAVAYGVADGAITFERTLEAWAYQCQSAGVIAGSGTFQGDHVAAVVCACF